MIELNNHILMPEMAIGTNWMTYKELYPIVKTGILAGFRAIDTARDYGNEPVVGKVIRDVLYDTGLKREDIFITTKIGNGQQRKGNINQEIEISLNNLETDYVDLWLMHWPYPNYYTNTWEKMECIYKNTNKVKAIGVANYDIRHFEELFAGESALIPAVNQIEYHPLRIVPDLVKYMSAKNIKMQAYAPLCRMIPPLQNSEILHNLSKKYNKSLGQIILRWHNQQGIMPIFKTYNESRFAENINIFDFSLENEEIKAISSLNQNYKYHLESASCPAY